MRKNHYLISILAVCFTQTVLAAINLEEWTSTNFVYDNNGNVTELLDGETGDIIGEYAYDPYGNTIKIKGKAAYENKVRFSTKEIDESGLYYYGYRYYNPQDGRWLNRDPIEEKGGFNVYGYVNNDAVNDWDILGKQSGAPSSLPLQFNIGQSLSIGGCFQAGPAIICVTGGYSISKGTCCDSSTGDKKDVVKLSGSISASTGVGLAAGFTYSYNPVGTLGSVGDCPSDQLSDIWDAVSGSIDLTMQVGFVTGGCSWSGPSSGWSCSGGFNTSIGVNAQVGGTLTVTGTFLE